MRFVTALSTVIPGLTRDPASFRQPKRSWTSDQVRGDDLNLNETHAC